MRERGLFSLDYSADVTHTARETFYTRQGNCLSFTILFVALAREAGLPVRYQMVDIPPIWSSKSEFIVLNNHINALIKTELQPSYVVDFNIEEFKGNYDTQEVNDSYALALFYSNLGVEALMAQDYETSFVYLSSAIRAYPRIPGPWVNLGLLYSRRGLYEYAESAYLNALDIDPRNRSALTDLAALYSAMGDEERAQAYRDRIRSYQQRNPYYHYALAQDAYQASRYTDALKLVAEAIKLKRNEHQFYFLQGLAYFRLGQRRDAENSFVQAKKYAELGETISLYDAKIEALSRER
jgi:tetratricopeptide (TPR) repeat protein